MPAICLQEREPSHAVSTLSWFQLITCAIPSVAASIRKKAACRVANEGQAALRILSQRQEVDTPKGMYPPQETTHSRAGSHALFVGSAYPI
jgi:hypothetical protein